MDGVGSGDHKAGRPVKVVGPAQVPVGTGEAAAGRPAQRNTTDLCHTENELKNRCRKLDQA